MKCVEYFIQRLHRLSDTLLELKERVRDAVAGELSRVVAQTVQDVVQTFLRGEVQPPLPSREPERRPWQEDEQRHWQDEDHDPWRDENDPDEPYPTTQQHPPIPEEAEPEPDPTTNNRWQRACTFGATVLCWVLGARWKPLIGVGIASILGTAAGCSSPILHAGSRVVLSAAELISFGHHGTLR